MKTIFVTIAGSQLVRNFFHGGVIKQLLDRGFRVVVLTPHYKNNELFREFEHENLFFEPLIPTPRLRFREIISELCRGSVFNETVHFLYRYHLTGERKPNMLYYPFRLIFFAPLRFLPFAKRFIRFIDEKLNPEMQHDYLFKKYNPSILLNTAACRDFGLIKSAKRYNIFSVDMPKSWDNLSKLLFYTKADYLIVWSLFMREQALKFQGYKDREIFVVGVPQFDFYSKKENLLTKEKFCQIHGLDPDKKIIMYASMGGIPGDEASYIELIRNQIINGKLANAQIFIRPHPNYRHQLDRFARLELHDGVVIDAYSKQKEENRDSWNMSKKHFQNLFSSLYYADVCVNFASTATLDAVVCGTPVINIKFDIEIDPEVYIPTQKFYKLDYVKAILKPGGTWVAESEEEFKMALQDILISGKKKDTRRLTKEFIYKNDGKSAERIANTLVDILETRK